MLQNAILKQDEDQVWKEQCDQVLEYLPSYRNFENRIRRNKVARLIAQLPYLAGTERPERDGMSNLVIFILSSYGSTKKLFRHVPEDDSSVFERLKPIMNFTGGNEKILDRGMSLIAMVLVNDYRRDMEEDLTTGHYNPLNSGRWNYEEIIRELTDRIRAVPCPKMDRILGLESIPFVVWNS
ncbi:MAG: hypothetical protein PQJ50_01920 [Spirochaetales bacterium]|nr:hypothetical protein [Spirochaetales bacterium]